MKKILGSTTLFLFLSVGHFVNAATIIDTGPGTTWGAGLSGQVSGYTQYLAGQFSLTDTAALNSISGWMNIYNEGDLTIKIYNNATLDYLGNNYAVPGIEIYAETRFVNNTYVPTQYDEYGGIIGGGMVQPDWISFSNLQWMLTSGDYWAVFEVMDQSTFYGSMPGYVATPLSNYAYDYSNYGYYNAHMSGTVSPDIQFGIRIEGETSPVPLPGSLLLLLSGLVTFGVRFSRKQNLAS